MTLHSSVSISWFRLLLDLHFFYLCTMEKYNLNHLRELESESIYVIREVAAQFEKPVILIEKIGKVCSCADQIKKNGDNSQNFHLLVLDIPSISEYPCFIRPAWHSCTLSLKTDDILRKYLGFDV